MSCDDVALRCSAPQLARTLLRKYHRLISGGSHDNRGTRSRCRRLCTAEFKRQQIERIERGQISAPELSCELDIVRSLLRRWTHLMAKTGETAMQAIREIVPVSELRAAQRRLRELERALGRKTTELAILHAARDEVSKMSRWYSDFPACRATGSAAARYRSVSSVSAAGPRPAAPLRSVLELWSALGRTRRLAL